MKHANATLGEREDATVAPAAGLHVLELRDVSLSFGEKNVLDGVSLTVDPQERLVIIGQSGAGKTTILRLILGVLQPTRGSVFFQGLEITRLRARELQQIRTRIGMVYQDAALLSSSTVRGNLALPLQELTDKSSCEIDRIVDEKLELVEMAGTGTLMPHELSGGMRKRVGLARALVMEPELILFDEPTQGLDPVVSALIDELIINLTKRSKVTSVIVTHLMDSAFRVATRMAMLHHGKIIEEGTPAHMKESKNPVLVQFLSGSTEGPILKRSKYHMLSPRD
jgi:phospholipid/cholesterol/gamma-HCH transport system ATP-binding protein